jgi:uncharacterized membrane protein YoaK (UPF0700 family)
LRPRVRDALLLTLTAAAGSTDAVTYLGLGRIFTANMTGNLVLLGIAIAQGQLAGATRSIVAFAAFGLGMLVGIRATPGTQRAAVWPRSATLVLVGELGLLLALLVGWEIAGDRPAALSLDILVAVSAGAMGMQTAAARRVGVVGVTTTFVTGMLTNLLADLATTGPARSHQAIWAETLASMAIGAALGAAVFLTWRPGAPLVAIVLVAACVIVGSGRSPGHRRKE